MSDERDASAPRTSPAAAGVRDRRAFDRSKRGFDIVVSTLGLIGLSPVLAATAVAVARTLGRPVLFRSNRAGRSGRPFSMVKFRTMLPVDPARGLIDDADRLTPLGSRLRALSLDELPELVNVLRGDMSLIGPRPLPVDYLPLYSPEQARRHKVRPGITGLAQVSGRNALTWEEKFEYDVWYVDHRSWSLDLSILVRTLLTVFRGDGISAEGHTTMHAFTGSPPSQESATTAMAGASS